MLQHNIKFDNKHNLKLIFRWNKLFKIRKADSIKRSYILKKMNEVCLKETYIENQLKHFKIWKIQIENVEKEENDLTRSLKNVEKFKKIIKIAEKNFKENFEMKKEKFN